MFLLKLKICVLQKGTFKEASDPWTLNFAKISPASTQDGSESLEIPVF